MRDYNDMDNQLKLAQQDNYLLRDYVISLQSRLIDAKMEVPSPPPNLSLVHPHSAPPPPPIQPIAPPEAGPSHPAISNPLAQVAQAVANLGQRGDHVPAGAYTSKEFKADGAGEERGTEDMTRQLQPEGLPAASM